MIFNESSLLCDEREWPRSLWQRLARRLKSGSEHYGWNGRLVVVLDELDKLTATEDGIRSFETILNDLKNILSTRGVYFILVGGADLHERWYEDARKGNSLYESVFASHVYVPCEWDMAERLLGSLVQSSSEVPLIGELRDFFDFESRGIPRRLLTELNSFVEWHNGSPFIVIGEKRRQAVAFYASMQQVVRPFLASRTPSEILGDSYDEDRWRLAIYYLLDWILRTNGREFTFSELVTRERDTRIVHASLEIDSDEIEGFIDYLVEHDVLEDLTEPIGMRTVIPDIPESDSRKFRLSRPVMEKLSGLADENQPGREPPLAPLGDISGEPPPIPPPPKLPAVTVSSEAETPRMMVGQIPRQRLGRFDTADGADQPATEIPRKILSPPGHELGPFEKQGVVGGRYEVQYLIGRGGMGVVYQARDRMLKRDVALKAISPHHGYEKAAMQRFLREAQIAASLSHSNIVHTFDLLRLEDTIVMVMELLQGPTLKRMSRKARHAPSSAAADQGYLALSHRKEVAAYPLLVI